MAEKRAGSKAGVQVHGGETPSTAAWQAPREGDRPCAGGHGDTPSLNQNAPKLQLRPELPRTPVPSSSNAPRQNFRILQPTRKYGVLFLMRSPKLRENKSKEVKTAISTP